MEVIKLHKQLKPEDENIYPFLKFYHRGLGGAIRYEAIEESTGVNTPDYYADEINALIEIKGIHDAEEKEMWAQWGRIVNKLQDQIEKHPRLKKVGGLYSVDTPNVFKLKGGKQLENAAGQILSAVIEGKNRVTVSGITFEIDKISDEGSSVHFATTSGGLIDAAGTIHQNLYRKLEVANRQLAFTPRGKDIRRRILLLANQYRFADRLSKVIRGLSFTYDDLLSYENIDEIWFQNRIGDGDYFHELLLTKEFLNGYEDGKIAPTEQNAELLAKWFGALEKIGGEHKEKLFKALRVFLEKKKPHEWFEDDSARKEMVELGIWLIDKDRLDDVDWLVDQFIGDPDPGNPDEYSGDPEFNYHKKIIEGKDPFVITSVLGHLAWVIQKLAIQREEEKKEYTLKAFEFTQKLLNHPNFYVKLQATIPLIEIAGRRQWIEGYGRRNSDCERVDKYREFHNTVFDLVDLVKKNPKCVMLAKWLSHVFAYYKDLSTEEAQLALDALRITSESAGPFIYFGIYRKDHYKNQKGIDFDGRVFEEKLKRLIKSRKKGDARLQSTIAWRLWKLLKGNPNEFDTLKPWLDIFFSQPFRQDVYRNLWNVIIDWVEKEPTICLDWFERYIGKALNHTKEHKDQHDRIALIHLKGPLTELAKRDSEGFLAVMRRLTSLWKLNVYIGNLPEIFKTYRHVSTKEREPVKRGLQKLYGEMKKLNPRVHEVDWDKPK